MTLTAFSGHGPAHALTVLTRLAQRQEQGKALLGKMLTGRLADLIEPALDVAAETGQPIGALLAEGFTLEGSDELAEWLARRLVGDRYHRVWPLHELSLLATRRFLDICRAKWTSPGPRQKQVLADLSHNDGRLLVTLGQVAEALPLLNEALSLYAGLGPKVASARIQCLGTCSEALTRLGQFPEALALAEEAVSASRAAARTASSGRRAEARLSLAGHLINLCGCLSDVDRHEDALTVIEEAVALYRCHRHDVGGYAQAYARALLCRGNELHNLNRYQEAAESLEEAITLARDLETERTTAFEPDLALALADLSLLYQQIGRGQDAQQALQEAIDRFRHLEGHYPESFRPSLAWSLSLLAPAGGSEPASLIARTEAVEHYRLLAARQPEVYEPQLGWSLFSLSEILLAAGDPRAALKAGNEAVTLLRRQALNQRDLAWSLLLRGRVRGALGHRRKAVADCKEAVALFRRRSARQNAFYNTDLAVALHELSVRLHYLGRFAEAIEVTREALEIYQRLAGSAPQVFAEDLASCLNSLSHHFYEAGRVEESIAATRESISIYRQLVDHRPEATYGLAASLSNLAPRLSGTGHPAEALEPALEAVALYRRVGDHLEGLATALHALGVVLLDLDKPEEAMLHLEEAVALRRRLAASQPQVHDMDLASSLVSLGKAFSDRGCYREALAKSRSGARLLRQAIKRGDTFLRPRLAVTLSNQAHQLRELGKPQAALAAAEEAVELLTPFFVDNPEAYWTWTTLALGNYMRACEAAGREPDLGKLAKVVAAFARGNE